ncbi:hypothetical protein G4B88_000652 [Cannabis sativa]|uniref:Uncharacterized protein n=1 Tax=Cannabis sativa TaxID=3483 RepID=A0A7J6HGU4_CANSA|nr:hypothetical protein G4B88_000652 [Cannabis sativa]
MLIGISKDLFIQILAAFMAIITSLSRAHGMALFLVLFSRCPVPIFPVRESPSALSGCKASSIKTSFSLSFLSSPFLILLIERGVKPLSKRVIQAVGGSLESCGSLLLHE